MVRCGEWNSRILFRVLWDHRGRTSKTDHGDGGQASILDVPEDEFGMTLGPPGVSLLLAKAASGSGSLRTRGI